MRHLVSLIVVVCLTMGSLSAATFEAVGDASLVGSADLVVVARVVRSESRIRSDGALVTDYRLAVESALKGSTDVDTIVVSEFGGNANGMIHIIPGSATYETGSRVVAFLIARPDGTWFTSHMALGSFRFERHGKMNVLTRNGSGLEVADHERTLKPRDAGAFLEYVRAAARGEQVEPYAPAASAGDDRRLPEINAAADYALKAGGIPVRWKDCEVGCLIGYFTRGDQAGVDDNAAIDTAMDVWTDHPDSFVHLARGGTSLVTNINAQADGENTILTNNSESEAFGECHASIACGGVWVSDSSKHTFKGVQFYTVLEGDLVIRPGSFSSSLYAKIVAHELGHTIALRDSNSGTPATTNALMHSVVTSGTAALQQWDRDALAEMYGNGIPCAAPQINSTSGGGTVASGQTKNLSVNASGTAPLNYQWYRGTSGDVSNPVGSNSPNYITQAITQDTTYWVRVSNACGSANSTNIVVTVTACTSPTVSNQPNNQQITPGSTATLSVGASGTSPFTYQWYRGASGDTSVPVGTNSSTFTTPALNSTTQYWVRVTNNCGDANSNTATITVEACSAPTITTQPSSPNVAPGTSATLTVAATGTSPLNFQWYQGAVENTSTPVGTNSSTFTTPPLHATTQYWVRVSNSCGGANSIQVTVTVGQCVGVNIVSFPTAVSVALGEGATLNVTTSGNAPVTYQWYQGESPSQTTPVAGGTNASLPVGPFLTPGTFRYWVRVQNQCGHANSATVVLTVACGVLHTPSLSAPPIAHFSSGYDVQWTINNAAQVGSFEVQEALNPEFTSGLKTFIVNGLEHHIDPHLEVTVDTRFYYRVRARNSCNQLLTDYSPAASTIVTRPQPSNSSEFSVSVDQDATQTFTQPYLVPGFGEAATSGDGFAITTDAPWLTVFPSSGALSAGGTTVQLTINPALIGVGSSTGTIVVTRTQGSGKGGTTVNASSNLNIPFTISKVTPVTPIARDASAPPGTLIIPAIAHADGIGTRFQSDVRIVNTSGAEIQYELSFTPSQTNGTQVGKRLTLGVGPNESKGLDDIVKAWYGSGILGEAGLGTLEIRPLGGVSPLSTFASSRTYAISPTGTLGQFIPAIGLEKFIGNIALDGLAKISLQQIANSSAYRTNLGFVEGSGVPANLRITLRDGANNILKQVERSIPAFGHEQTSFKNVFGDVAVTDGRVEVEVLSSGGKATAYASVLDNQTNDPLLVFPVQAQKVSAQRFVVPGVAELENGPASNFHTDMRIYNASITPTTINVGYYPQGAGAARPADVQLTLAAGEVRAIDNILPTLWSLTGGGAVAVDAPPTSQLVLTARTYSRDADGGTYGQFIPGVTAADAVGLGERSLEVLQLEQSAQYRTNLGLVEVTGNPVKVEILGQTGNKVTARTEATLSGNEFRQLGRVFEQMGFGTAVYTGRISVRVIEGTGRVCAYGSVVDNRTVDPTYVPAQ
jgi:hypothetical protein